MFLWRGQLKIVRVVSLHKCGAYARSRHWARTRSQIHDAVRRCEWPIGTGKFTIYPESGKRRGEGNGVVPIRAEFIRQLRQTGWVIEGKAKSRVGDNLGNFD